MTVLVADAGLLGIQMICPSDCELRIYSGRRIPKALLDGADALFVRSTARFSADDVPNSVRFIGTATIGTDHLPLSALAQRGIHVESAPGCNADAVVDYVFWHLLEWADYIGEEIQSLTLGVIGVGQVGTRLVARARSLGLSVLQSDLPKYVRGELDLHCSIDEVMTRADVVSLHFPLVTKGCYSTDQLIDIRLLSQMKSRSLLINAARGSVLSENAILSVLFPDLVLDVFPKEPFVSDALLERVWRVTPHIAGHSAEGKLNGTEIILGAYSRFAGTQLSPFNREELLQEVAGPSPTGDNFIVQLKTVDRFDLVNRVMRQKLLNNSDRKAAFDVTRDGYRLRRETTPIVNDSF